LKRVLITLIISFLLTDKTFFFPLQIQILCCLFWKKHGYIIVGENIVNHTKPEVRRCEMHSFQLRD
jgi:hypothetical protein